MNRNLFTIIWLGSLLFLQGCVDEIQFDPPAALVDAFSIQSKLIKGDPSTVEVNIQRVFDFQSLGTTISFQEVALVDELDNKILLKGRKRGRYRQVIPNNHSTFKVDYGRGYKIRLVSTGGDVFESNYDEIYPVATPDSLVARQIKIDFINAIGNIEPRSSIGVYLYTPTKAGDNSLNNRFLWDISYTYKVTDSPQAYSPVACCYIPLEDEPKTCYLKESPSRNSITFDASNLITDRINDVELYRQVPFYLFAEGFYLTVRQQSLSEAALDYWEQVSLVINRTGSVFQDPVGRVVTNFRKLGDDIEIYGFFYATEEKVIRTYISPELAYNPAEYCPISGTTCAPILCCNCALVENSSTIKPEWWTE